MQIQTAMHLFCLGHWQRLTRLVITSADKGQQALFFTVGRSETCRKHQEAYLKIPTSF